MGDPTSVLGEGSLAEATFTPAEAAHVATVDMTTEGVEETTVVTATVLGLEDGLELAGKTTVCFWVGVVSTEVEASLDKAALLWL